MTRTPPLATSNWQLATLAPLYLILLPTFSLLAIFCLIPFCWAFVTSFYEYEVGAPAQFVGLSNYTAYLFHDATLGQSLRNMTFLTLFATVVTVIIPLVIAKLIFSLSSPRASYFYRILFLIPVLVPGVATQLIWKDFIYSGTGLLNELLAALHLSSLSHGWLSDPHTVLPAIASIGFPFAGGINILIYYAGLTAIPDSVHEAATLDGSTGLHKFLSIDLPLLLSQIKLLVILTLIAGIQSFESLFILTRGGPGFRSTVPGLWMYFNAFSFQKMGYACSIGVLLFLLILTLTILNLKYFRTSEDLQVASSQ